MKKYLIVYIQQYRTPTAVTEHILHCEDSRYLNYVCEAKNKEDAYNIIKEFEKARNNSVSVGMKMNLAVINIIELSSSLENNEIPPSL